MTSVDLARAGTQVTTIPVAINYDIIRLFSEGLYSSPHKAIEELVSNSYDAGARRTHVILPEPPQNREGHLAPLWVIDDGCGMDENGFGDLWQVAQSNKKDREQNGRLPIGQFGIGKLASYVLARKLVHLSCVKDRILFTVMDFTTVTGRNSSHSQPVTVSLREISKHDAKRHLADIEHRDPHAWSIMFDDRSRALAWTAAGLSNFKKLYKRISTGRLRWVLSTALPLHSDFSVFLNGDRVTSSKLAIPEIKSISIKKFLPGIGLVSGEAKIYQKQLTSGKSANLGRSHGFFIRVRKRVINMEDELFGVQQLNHAAWSRFALDVEAEGLRNSLLSSREGVRDSHDIRKFREELLSIFNECRQAYDTWNRKTIEKIDLSVLLSDSPSSFVMEPLSLSVRSTINAGSESFYIEMPDEVDENNKKEWLSNHEREFANQPFAATEFKEEGPHAPVIRYHPGTRKIFVNSDHPFIDKLTSGNKFPNPAKIFAGCEVLLEGQIQEQGIDRSLISNFLTDRDRILRLMAGESPPTAEEILRQLNIASHHKDALERAVGVAFGTLGFDYQRRGGNKPGPDGILFAHLGRHGKTLADYKIVYDAKTSDQPKIRAEHVDMTKMEEFRCGARAQFGFFVASAYAGEDNDESALNRRMETSSSFPITLLKICHLRDLVRLHFRYGVTLTEIRSLFKEARTVRQVNEWIEQFQKHLASDGDVPIAVLLDGLEKEKHDRHAAPNINAVRAKNSALQIFDPDRLAARLKAVENIIGPRWIEIDMESRDVLMHQTADEILEAFNRNLGSLADSP